MDFIESHGPSGSVSQLYNDAEGKYSYEELRVGLAFMDKMQATE